MESGEERTTHRGQFSPSTKWGPRDGTWVVRFLYLLGPLNCPEFLSTYGYWQSIKVSRAQTIGLQEEKQRGCR